MYKIQPKTVFVGKRIKYLPTCHSTNESCLEYLESQAIEEGFSIYTSRQTRGKGQRGNIWEAETDRNITMSIVLKPNFLKPSEQFQLNIAISVGIFYGILNYLTTLESIDNLDFNFNNFKIKWPNDIYYSHFKIGGILIENTISGNSINYSIIGIGLNINQLNFGNPNASSLRKILNINQDLDLGAVMCQIFEEVEGAYMRLKEGQSEVLKNDFLNRLFRINEWHPFRRNNQIFQGKIVDIDTYGRLIMDTQAGQEVFDFKEVEFVI